MQLPTEIRGQVKERLRFANASPLSRLRKNASEPVSYGVPRNPRCSRTLILPLAHLHVVLADKLFVPEGLELPDVYERRPEVSQRRVYGRNARRGPVREAHSDVHHGLQKASKEKSVRRATRGEPGPDIYAFFYYNML